jgi:hypothetical protein
MLSQPLTEFNTEEMEYSLKKDLGKVGLSFNICNESDSVDLQSSQTMEGLKLLTLMHELIAI